VGDNHTAELLGIGGILQDLEFLPVDRGVQSGGKQEVSSQDSPGFFEDFLYAVNVTPLLLDVVCI